MNILVTGSHGQLGNELQKIAKKNQSIDWFFTDVNDLDITSGFEVDNFFVSNHINICINCAAYTAVDKAEDEPEFANRINADAVRNLADACLQANALLIHISTDYVFDGENYKPYEENDPIKPISVYGHTKANAEIILAGHEANSVIIRTSWLYSSVGNNFVKTMIRVGNDRPEIRVVSDQVGTPTWAYDLAEAIFRICILNAEKNIKKIYHFSNEGVISWYDFAVAIMELENIACKVVPIESKDYPVKTKRPFYSVLNKTKYKNDLKAEIPFWRDSLKKCLEEIHGQNQTR
ncbi:MAG: dTDP-4-dehydrorhamnose reductase [Bacteroidales bacterium]|nr:dTDP-4-dehydrorhamnose reductase [Bacteroidales bacterium]